VGYCPRKPHSLAAARTSNVLRLTHLIIPAPESTRQALRASVRFAAILCEISGSFLIFPFGAVHGEPQSVVCV
jgi:hypothetical protein